MTDQTNKQEPTTSGEPAPSAIIPVENIHEFVHFLNGWHSERVRQLRHMVTMPEGITMVTGGEGTDQPEASVIMEGEMLAGFKAGIELALMQLGTLPFSVELEDAQTH